MIDPDITFQVNMLKQHVAEINEIMEYLHSKKVEVRIQYKFEENPEKKPMIAIWRCVGHDDYLQ